jgi:Rod binding domain-containing protein
MSTEIKNFPNAESLTMNARMKSATFGTRNSELGTRNSELSTRKVAEEFASLLLLEMLKSMRATVSGEGLDGDKSSSRDTYAALADVEVTRALARRDGIGLTAFLEQSLRHVKQTVDAQASSSMADEEEGP